MKKDLLLDKIITERRRLLKNIDDLSDEQLEIAGVTSAGWSVKDIMAHLFEWEGKFISWYEIGKEGVDPEPPAPGLKWNQLTIVNQKIYEKYKNWELKRVRKQFNESYERTLNFVQQLSEEEIFTKGYYEWLGKSTFKSYISANTSGHYLWAKKKIRQWKKEKGLL
ncbi:MAG: ClbS/DfsB family four-helix bundle protein [Candidatus Heimdallarchaeota archaeon]|nr:ClbS/DfsB family four-helix bundle protein [Candidatus Heimdallarchaeota archaeon]